MFIAPVDSIYTDPRISVDKERTDGWYIHCALETLVVTISGLLFCTHFINVLDIARASKVS